MSKPSDFLGGSASLRAEDVPVGAELRLKIAGHDEITLIDNDSKKEKEKLLLRFDGKEKGLVLNDTNLKVLIGGFGDDFSQWRGQSIVIYRTTTELKGKTVPALRLRLPTQEISSEDIPF